MKKYGLVFNITILSLFFILLIKNGNTIDKSKYISCIKLSIKNCEYNTQKRKNDIVKNCKIIVRHNQEIDQVDNFYTCKQRKK